MRYYRCLCAELFDRAKRLQHLVVVVNPRGALVLCRWHKENFIFNVRPTRISHACARQRFIEKPVTIC
jgi:hypothetical protein